MSDAEIFARLIFYGVTLLGRDEGEVWLMPFGHMLDQWEVYRQYNGMAQRAKPQKEATIDDVIPFGLF